jgi:hypothetical protein
MPGFETADFLAAVEHYPHHIMPEYRKRRAYISSILSKNEIFRNDPYNRQLFLRIRHGYYIINPILEVETDEGWKNIYDVLQVMHLEKTGSPDMRRFLAYLRKTQEKLRHTYIPVKEGEK